MKTDEHGMVMQLLLVVIAISLLGLLILSLSDRLGLGGISEGHPTDRYDHTQNELRLYIDDATDVNDIVQKIQEHATTVRSSPQVIIFRRPEIKAQTVDRIEKGLAEKGLLSACRFEYY